MEQPIRVYFSDYMHAQMLIAIAGVDFIKVGGQVFRKDPETIKDIFDSIEKKLAEEIRLKNESQI